MKKILSVVLALAMICGLAVNAFAVGISVETDKNIIEAGEEITVTLTMDETIGLDQNVTLMQAQLTYDKTLFTCESATLSEEYAVLPGATATISSRNPRVQFSCSDFNKNVFALPAGVIGTATFTAVSDIAASTVEAAFSLTNKISDVNGTELYNLEESVSITICAGHQWEMDYENSTYGSCETDGELHYDCAICGAHKTEADPAVGHQFSDEWAIDVQYIEDENGNLLAMEQYYGCWVCGAISYTKMLYVVSLDNDYNIFPTATTKIPAGESIELYVMGFTGYTLEIHGATASATVTVSDWMTGETTEYSYEPVDGVIYVPIESYEAFVEVKNNGTEADSYGLSVDIPLGDWANPQDVTLGDNTVSIEADNYYGYYTQYVAEADGHLLVTITGATPNYSISTNGDPDNYYDNLYYGTFWATDADYSTTYAVPVIKGEVVEFCFDTSDANYEYPAMTFTLNLAIEEHVLGHVDAVDPDCTTNGNIEHYACSICHGTFDDDKASNRINVSLSALGHQHVLVEAQDPTCTTEGHIEHYTCPDCGTNFTLLYGWYYSQTDDVSIPALGHTMTHVDAVAPSCTEDGNIEYYHCSVCELNFLDEEGNEAVTDVVDPATGHTYSAVVTDPTCTDKGYTTHTCDTCGDSYADTYVDATGHTYSDVVTDPTCTEKGYTTHTCDTCGHSYADTYVDATGHTYGEWTEAKAPTCAEEGEKEHECACGHKETEAIPALGHTYGEDGVCTVCGDNPKSGDTVSAIVVAAAIISVLSIVALPVAKKHF